MIKMSKMVQKGSLAVLAVYFVSMIAGPAMGFSGAAGKIKYVINAYQYLGDSATDVLVKGTSYHIAVICQNEGAPVTQLNVVLPAGFEMLKTPASGKMWPWLKDWTHSFEIKAPEKAGQYQWEFSGKDDQVRNVDFSASIEVVADLVSYNAEKNSQKAAQEAVAAEAASLQERTVSISPDKTIVFPKGFESENPKTKYFAVAGIILGIGAASYTLSNQKDNMAVITPFYALMLGVAVVVEVVGGWALGSMVDRSVDGVVNQNTDIAWINLPNKDNSQKAIRPGNIIYISAPLSLYQQPVAGTTVGAIKQGEFRRVLGSSEIDGSIWYKIKRTDKPIFN
jgi:hypothetical protein